MVKVYTDGMLRSGEEGCGRTSRVLEVEYTVLMDLEGFDGKVLQMGVDRL
jgi:hypothetical protein